MEYWVKISEVEDALTDWAKGCGVSDELIADAWHSIFTRMLPKMVNREMEKYEAPGTK